MATDAASSETTATVLRATAGQLRLQLEGGREVTKRVSVPEEAREALVGASVPVTVTGTGDRARVELGEGWADAGAKKQAPAKRRRARTGGEDDTPAAESKKPASRSRAKKAAPAKAAPAEDEPAEDEPAQDEPAVDESTQEQAPAAEQAPAQDAPAEAPKKRSRSRSRGTKATADAPEPAADVTPDADEAPTSDGSLVSAAPETDVAVPTADGSEIDTPSSTDEAPTTDAATPGSSPALAEEPVGDAKPKRSRSRSRGGRGRKDASTEAATPESPGKADAPVLETPPAPVFAEDAPSAPAPKPEAPAPVVALDDETLRTRIAAAVDLVRAARAA